MKKARSILLLSGVEAGLCAHLSISVMEHTAQVRQREEGDCVRGKRTEYELAWWNRAASSLRESDQSDWISGF